MVAGGHLFRQLGDRLVEHLQVIACVVRPGVARPLHPRKRPRRWRRRSRALGGSRSRPCSSVPPPSLFSEWTVTKRGVDVEDDRGLAARRLRVAPDAPAHVRHRLPQVEERLLADLVAHRAVERRVGRHRPEERLLLAQLLDVKTALAAARQHQHRLHEDLSPVVDRRHMAAPGDRRRQRIGEPEAVGEPSKDVQADVADDACAACFHLHRGRVGLR